MNMIQPHLRKCGLHVGVTALLIGGTLAGTAAIAADAADPGVAEYAARLAVTVCGSCHGADGNSVQPKFPRLAGQNAAYLAAQLRAFKAQSRGDPDAVGYMWGMAAELDDVSIDALAAYYAAQTPPRASTTNHVIESRGREIYEHGVESQGVPACAACHGPDGHGLQGFPRLAGQHDQYLMKQLTSFQSNMRNVAVMHGVAQNLRFTEMRSVTAYLETLP